jgi:nucleotide-binding universal stress UspA family protein
MIRRVLHPSDFSKASSAAFKKAVEMAKADRAELMVVHVVNPIVPVVGEGYVSPKMYEDVAESTRAWAQKQLDKLLAKAKQGGRP